MARRGPQRLTQPKAGRPAAAAGPVFYSFGLHFRRHSLIINEKQSRTAVLERRSGRE